MVDFDLSWPSFWLGGLLAPVGLGVAWFLLLATVAYAARPVGKMLRRVAQKRHIVWYWIKYLGVNRDKVRNAQLEAANEGQDTPVSARSTTTNSSTAPRATSRRTSKRLKTIGSALVDGALERLRGW